MSAHPAAPGPSPAVRPPSAIYLRCYPQDDTAMDCQGRALHALAESLGFAEPALFRDRGRRPQDGLPELEALLDRVEAGLLTVVLVPGPFVFALDDGAATAAVDRLHAHGCRVVELPAQRVPVIATAA
ncbi:recombinase family protein [Kitasatospora sp. NPDC006697]|uniref:recombinase family protein n=1 Tax=Kitasatospora sp. NPDC006697 TaxID=3364020 RepID=UPI0036B9FB42